ncbi:MAG: transposase [Campylobacterales bacterium]|nr:transposase [Campylobacterales bacterium]
MANYKRVFLDGYSYFITIVTHLRQPILIEQIELLRESFKESKRYFHYRIDAIVILPDHLHMIITPQNANEYPNIIKAIKYNFTKRYKSDNSIPQSSSRLKDRMQPIWQKRYYEHTIRDEQDWNEKMEYIKDNPIKHGLVDIWHDWEYSSFKA